MEFLKKQDVFVTAIGTDSGKTVVSAIVAQALGAAYWKPVQSGLPRDADTVAAWVSHPAFEVFPSTYELQMPASPHASAAAEGVEIQLERIVRPHTTKPLVVEGAGGVLVPLNRRHFVIDIALQLQVPVILVSNLYLGSINHTLLTYEALKARRVPVLGIVFNGEPNPQSEDIILHHTGYKKLLHILPEQKIDTATIERYAEEFRKNIYELTGER